MKFFKIQEAEEVKDSESQNIYVGKCWNRRTLLEGLANCADGLGALFAELPTTLAGCGELTDSPG